MATDSGRAERLLRRMESDAHRLGWDSGYTAVMVVADASAAPETAQFLDATLAHAMDLFTRQTGSPVVYRPVRESGLVAYPVMTHEHLANKKTPDGRPMPVGRMLLAHAVDFVFDEPTMEHRAIGLEKVRPSQGWRTLREQARRTWQDAFSRDGVIGFGMVSEGWMLSPEHASAVPPGGSLADHPERQEVRQAYLLLDDHVAPARSIMRIRGRAPEMTGEVGGDIGQALRMFMAGTQGVDRALIRQRLLPRPGHCPS